MGRSKTILAFMLSPRSYICCAIMAREYVDLEQVYIECVDSTPLQESEVPEDRQKLMSCIILGYFAHVRQRGFREVLLRVPPPTDETGFVFSPRRPSAPEAGAPGSCLSACRVRRRSRAPSVNGWPWRPASCGRSHRPASD